MPTKTLGMRALDTEAKAHSWDNNNGNLQAVTLGVQFKFGPNALLDFTTGFRNPINATNLLDNQIWGALLNATSLGLTVKY